MQSLHCLHRVCVAFLLLNFLTALHSASGEGQVLYDFSGMEPKRLLEFVEKSSADTATLKELPILLEMNFGVRSQMTHRYWLKSEELEILHEAECRLITARSQAMESFNSTELTTLVNETLEHDIEWREPSLFKAICRRWIEEEIRQILAEPPPQFTQKIETPLPPRGYWEETIAECDPEAWREFERAVRPFRIFKDEAEKMPPIIWNVTEKSPYEKYRKEIFTGKATGVANEILRLKEVGGGFCEVGFGGMWSNERYRILIFMALLRERRLAEAVGASAEAFWELYDNPHRPMDRWRIDLIRHCGFDWESVLIGQVRWKYLAAHGSGRAGRTLLCYVNSNRPEIRLYKSAEPLVAFIAPHGAKRKPESANEDFDHRTLLSSDLQNEILTTLADFARRKQSFHELGRLLDSFQKLRRPELKEVLFEFARHPSTTIAAKATDALQAMGESLQDVAPAPLRFLMLLNGAPLVNHQFSQGTTDENGFLSMSRDDVLDPVRSVRWLYFEPWSHRLALSPTGNIFELPWVSKEVEAPKSFDTPIQVNFEACPLPIEIEFGFPFERSKEPPIYFEFLRLSADTDVSKEWRRFWFEKARPQGDSTAILFEAFQPGLYQFRLYVPGAVSWTSPTIDVRPGMAPIKVKLEKGVFVGIDKLHQPPNVRSRGPVQLFRNGIDVTELCQEFRTNSARNFLGNESTILFAHVPIGKYELRIPSSESGRTSGSIEDHTEEGVATAEVRIPFQVTEDTPTLLNLGSITVPEAVPFSKRVKQWFDRLVAF